MILIGIVGYAVLVCLVIVLINGFLAPLFSIVGLVVSIAVILAFLALVHGYSEFIKGIKLVSKRDYTLPKSDIEKIGSLFAYLQKAIVLFTVIILLAASIAVLSMISNKQFSISEVIELSKKALTISLYCLFLGFSFLSPIRYKLEVIKNKL